MRQKGKKPAQASGAKDNEKKKKGKGVMNRQRPEQQSLKPSVGRGNLVLTKQYLKAKKDEKERSAWEQLREETDAFLGGPRETDIRTIVPKRTKDSHAMRARSFSPL